MWGTRRITPQSFNSGHQSMLMKLPASPDVCTYLSATRLAVRGVAEITRFKRVGDT